MGYFGPGQFGYFTNPFMNGINPFNGYFNNPSLSYNFGSSIFPQVSTGYNNFGFFPSFSEYNFLNSAAPLSGTNYNFSNPGSLAPTGCFGNSNPLLGGGLGSLGTPGGFGGFGSYNNYNFLGSTPSYPPTAPTFNFGLQSPYSFNNFSNFNFNTSFQTQTLQNTQNEQSGSEKTLDKKQGYGPEFLAKVKKIANEINCNYKDLLGVMNSESGIKSDAVNKQSNATGLIQFMPKTAQGMGTSVERLKKMTPLEQLDYVEKFLKTTKKQAGFSENAKLSAGQLYALVFMPAKAKQEVFTTKGEKAYNWNKGLDLNKDGKITMTELGQRVISSRVSDSSFLA